MSGSALSLLAQTESGFNPLHLVALVIVAAVASAGWLGYRSIERRRQREQATERSGEPSEGGRG